MRRREFIAVLGSTAAGLWRRAHSSRKYRWSEFSAAQRPRPMRSTPPREGLGFIETRNLRSNNVGRTSRAPGASMLAAHGQSVTIGNGAGARVGQARTQR
jgi:hypothetical protein